MRAAAFCATRNLYPDLAPPIKALLHNSNVEKIFLLLEDDDAGQWLPSECEIINVSGQTYFPPGSPNYGNGWSYMVLMRAVLWKIFPNLDRILSIDVDAFVLSDISHMWELNMEHKCFAGVKETCRDLLPGLNYYNAGMLMQNLSLLRESGLGEECHRALLRRSWAYPEQDVFSLVCSGCFLTLPPEYNAGIGTEPYGDPIIRHFMAEQKTYRQSEIFQHFKNMPWDEVR